MGDNWKPFAALLIGTFIVGGILTAVTSPFVTLNSTANSTIASQIYNYTQSGVIYNLPLTSWLSVPIPNLWAVIPNSISTYVIADIMIIQNIPLAISIPFFALWFFALFWTIVAMVKPGAS